MLDEIRAFDAAFPYFLMSTGIAGGLLIVAATAYIRLTPWKELALVREGNAAAGVALGGAIAGLGIPIASTLASSVSIAELAIWGATALLMQLITYRVVDCLLRDIPGRLARDEMGAAAVLTSAKLSTALILAAGLSDPVLQRI
jgi:putative membrane protein